jgi:single-stranded-DNA-specific exonuclease
VTDGALVLADPAWHPGIVGLAAGRLAEAYRRPAALASIGADGRARISMRAGVGWADLALGIQAWQADPSLEFRGGGHQGAAGGSVPVDRLERFAESFCRVMDAQRPLEAAAHSVAVDAELGLAELTLGACDAIGRLAPFGPGNLSPTLLVRGVRLVDTRQLGSTGRHLRLNLIDGQGVRATAVWWDASASHLSPGCWLDLLALPERNEFNGTIEVRLSVQGARPAARPTPLLI